MKTVFETYSSLWGEDILKSLGDVLKKVYVLRIPEEFDLISKANPLNTIIVITKPSIYVSVKILSEGFFHCISLGRKDFSWELLATALMCHKPNILTHNKQPFSFRSFVKKNEILPENNFYFTGTSTRQKKTLLEQFNLFLAKHKKTQTMNELAIEIADEIFSNAFFHSGLHKKSVTSRFGIRRTDDVFLESHLSIDFFATIDDEILTFGCMDPFGNIDRHEMILHLQRIYASDKAIPNLGEGGTGLGVKMMIDNSASIYIYCEKNIKTIFACSLLLKGLKENLKPTKHIHLITVGV